MKDGLCSQQTVDCDLIDDVDEEEAHTAET